MKAGYRKVIIFALPGNVLMVSPIMDQYICTGEVSAAMASKVSPIMDPNMRGFLRASSRWRRNVDFNMGQRRTVKTAFSSSKNTDTHCLGIRVDAECAAAKSTKDVLHRCSPLRVP